MKSIRDIYKIGTGPSSSHTMGPARAAVIFRGEHSEADKFQAILYGSLSKTAGATALTAPYGTPLPPWRQR